MLAHAVTSGIGIPGAGDVFLDAALIECLRRRPHVLVHDNAARQPESSGIAAGVGWKVAVGQKVADALTQASPVLVKGGNQQQVGDVDLFDKLPRLSRQRPELSDALRIDGVLFGWVHGHRHATHQIGLGMRVFASQQGVDLDDLALPVQRLQIVGDGQQVSFGRQFVGRMAPVGVRKQAKLATVYEGLKPVSNSSEILDAGIRPVRDRLRQGAGGRRI
jgi:hypothetical protein